MGTDRVGVTSYPLYWPMGRPRTPYRRQSAFRNSNVFVETKLVRKELELLGAKNIIVSTNLMLRGDGIPYSGQKRPQDPGVSVWFDLKGVQHAFACDQWNLAEDNLRAIAKHVEAMRGQLRWKVATAQEAFAGFKALPESAGGDPWWVTLGCAKTADREAVDRAFKIKARSTHPDAGGSHEDWLKLQRARELALQDRATP